MAETAHTSMVAQMFAWLTRKWNRRRNARELYGSSVTQARQPTFYAAWGIPDTLQGRFEMILLHVSLLAGRLQREGEAGARLAQAVSEAFIADMDASMREMTFSDLAVPREIKRAAAALFDRHNAYRAGLEGGEREPLARALEAELGYLAEAGRVDAVALAHYMFDVENALRRQPGADLLAGCVLWQSPGASEAPSQEG